MPAAAGVPGTDAGREAVAILVREGLALGVGEVGRRMAGAEHARPGPDRGAQIDHVVDGLLAAVDADQPVLGQLIKEVWGRGAAPERRVAARATGVCVRIHAPHRALALARELAVMTASDREADMVGDEALLPLLRANPTGRERFRSLLQDAEASVRRAAARALVASCATRRDVSSVTSILLEAAQQPRPGDERLLRSHLRSLSKVDAGGVARSLSSWGREPGPRRVLAESLAQAAGVRSLLAPPSGDVVRVPNA